MRRVKEQQLLYKRFSDLCRMAYQRGIPMYSEFTDLPEYSLARQAVKDQYQDLSISQLPIISYGGYEEAERRILCFLPESDYLMPAADDYPLCCIRIAPINKRFGERLSHRDYLGTIMGLGLERDQIGDILVRHEDAAGNSCTVGYVFCKQKIAKLLTEITRIQHTTVEAQNIKPEQLHWEQQYKNLSGTVSSLRLDAVLSVAIRTSRTQGLQLIREGNVSINGISCTENAKTMQNGDVFSVRGYGKYRLQYLGGTSKKGRYPITVKQYI